MFSSSTSSIATQEIAARRIIRSTPCILAMRNLQHKCCTICSRSPKKHQCCTFVGTPDPQRNVCTLVWRRPKTKHNCYTMVSFLQPHVVPACFEKCGTLINATQCLYMFGGPQTRFCFWRYSDQNSCTFSLSKLGISSRAGLRKGGVSAVTLKRRPPRDPEPSYRRTTTIHRTRKPAQPAHANSPRDPHPWRLAQSA